MIDTFQASTETLQDLKVLSEVTPVGSFDKDSAARGRILFNGMAKCGVYHDGRFATLRDVIDHYDRFFTLGLTEPQKLELGDYLKSL